jgi:hypothetical protein
MPPSLPALRFVKRIPDLILCPGATLAVVGYIRFEGALLEQNHDKRALKRIFQSFDFLENQHSKALTSGISIVILL